MAEYYLYSIGCIFVDGEQRNSVLSHSSSVRICDLFVCGFGNLFRK